MKMELIANGESRKVEFKESLKLKDEIGQAVSAFSNASGGKVLVGVGDDGRIKGIEIGKKTVENLANYIKQHTDPQIYPRISLQKTDNKRIVIIEVEESSEKPVFFKARAYKRIGRATHKLASSEIRKLARESGGKVYWDRQVCEEAGLDDIDDEKVKWYLEKRENVRKIPKQLDIKDLLINIGAAKKAGKEIKPTNAGILLFGKVPQRYIPTRIIGARFKGTELSRTTTDTIDCSGTLWEMLEQAEEFVRKNIRLFGFRTGFSFRRIDKLEYPIDAVREAIINALTHRDYFELSDTRLFIFDNRIEVINPGAFPKGVTPEKPIHKPRNPVMCQLMRDVGFIEKYGSGIYFMKNLCEEWGIPRPQYKITEMETKVVFESGGEAVIVSEIEKLGIELNERQRKALEHSFSRGFLTRLDYMRLNGVSHKTAHKELADLMGKGLLVRKGKGRSVKYLIIR
jgi:ATP-dependent DNA helicase RecG